MATPKLPGSKRGGHIGEHELGVVGEIGAPAVMERIEEHPPEDLELDAARGAYLGLGLGGELAPEQLDGLLGPAEPLLERVRRHRGGILSGQSGPRGPADRTTAPSNIPTSALDRPARRGLT